MTALDTLQRTPFYRDHQKRQFEHTSRECYSKNCFSCSCRKWEGKACYAHKGEDSYKNELLERIAIAQEKIAANISG